MALADFAETEIRAAGMFNPESDYNGEVGKAVMELVRVFSSQGHSGMSAHIVLDIFNKVARYQPLTPMKNPMQNGEFIIVDERMTDGKRMLQSTRKYSMFSDDDGETWYDIDKRVPWYMKLFGVRKMPVKF